MELILLGGETGCDKYQENTASGLGPSAPLVGNSFLEYKNYHINNLTLAQSVVSGKLQILKIPGCPISKSDHAISDLGQYS